MFSASSVSSVSFDKSEKKNDNKAESDDSDNKDENGPRCALYLYKNEHSADNSSQRDAEIGVFNSLVGSNKNLGKTRGTAAFVMYKNSEGTDMIRFVGFTGERSDAQPWMRAGGNQWDYVYSISRGGTQNKTLSEFAARFGLQVSMIKYGTITGWLPKGELYRPAFQRSIHDGYWD